MVLVVGEMWKFWLSNTQIILNSVSAIYMLLLDVYY